MEQEAKIKVNIEELIQRLQDMIDDEYTTAELIFEGSSYEEDNVIKLLAVDVISDESIDYGTVYYDDGEL